QCECNPITLTANEKKMILSVYRYLKSQWANNAREEVSLATGVSEVTVACVLSEFILDTDYVKVIQDLILSANQNSITLSLRIFVLDLSELGFSTIEIGMSNKSVSSDSEEDDN
ncbi:29466_t:CDS:2, partial [Gigaspora margarita]